MTNLSEIANRVSKEHTTSEIVYFGLAGSRSYGIKTARDTDLIVIVEGDQDFPHILSDSASGVHVFLRSVGFINRLLDGRVKADLNSPTLTGLNKEAAEAIGLDYFNRIDDIKRVVALDAAATFCSSLLVEKGPDGRYHPTRQCKGLYHALAFMYKVKNQSFDLTPQQITRLTEAHDLRLPEKLIDEIYEFYDLSK